MPLPKIEQPEQIVLQEGQRATKLVKVVKLSKEDPTAATRLPQIAEQAAADLKKTP